ncbi:MAG: 4Fe-4S dicluster domain-containing protein [Waddliaceae bacterium]
MDRRGFFRQALHFVSGFRDKEDGKSQQSTVKKQRPPGAAPTEEEFLQRCTGCDACMAACPVHVIMIEDRKKRDPIIYPQKDPCIHCPGYPCIQACPTGALHKNNSLKLRTKN